MRILWLIVAVAMLVGGATTLSLSLLLAVGRWWYDFSWPDSRVAALVQAGLVFWTFAAGAWYAAGPRTDRLDVSGDYEDGPGGAVRDRQI